MNPVIRDRVKLHIERLSRNCDYTVQKEHINFNAWKGATGYSDREINKVIECLK